MLQAPIETETLSPVLRLDLFKRKESLQFPEYWNRCFGRVAHCQYFATGNMQYLCIFIENNCECSNRLNISTTGRQNKNKGSETCQSKERKKSQADMWSVRQILSTMLEKYFSTKKPIFETEEKKQKLHIYFIIWTNFEH